MLIATVLSQSVSELSMLIIVWSMCITVAGCTFYFLEADANPTILSGNKGIETGLNKPSNMFWFALYLKEQ